MVVPTRNRAALLERLLGQLARIDDPLAYEFVVIDEASADETPDVVARATADPRFRGIRHQTPKGISSARNVGIEAARGRYVAFIDDDDLTSTDRLRRQHEALEGSEARWSCAAKVDIDDDLAVIGHGRCPSAEGFAASILRFNSLPAAGQGLLVERALVVEVGAFDPAIPTAEDWELCIRLAQVSTPHLLDEPLVGYRTGVESLSTDTGRMERSVEAIVAKHAALYEHHGVRPDWAAIDQSLLAADLLTSRRQGARRALRIVRASPSPKAIARALATLAVPRRFEERSRAARRRQVPPDWEAQARVWLDQIPDPDRN